MIKMSDKMLTLEKFEEASEKVKEATLPTDLVYSEYFSNQTDNKVYLKPENMQFTGAYKVRGAYYKISTLTEDERKRGLITASAGNHAQGVAYAAKCFGVKATIVMPTTTPLRAFLYTNANCCKAAIAFSTTIYPASSHSISQPRSTMKALTPRPYISAIKLWES